MSLNHLYSILVFFCGWFAYSQIDSTEVNFVKLKGDEAFKSSIELKEVYVFAPLKFKDSKAIYRYLLLKRRTLKVYPYAKLAADKLIELNDSIVDIKKKRHQKRYLREMQHYIEDEFSEELKKLTRSEGQILIKLVHRQTGSSTYDLVKELRSGWRAFWYATTAKMFNLNMKAEFHPDHIHEDYLIEDILQRAFMDDILEFQQSALNYDFAKLHNKWSDPKNSRNKL